MICIIKTVYADRLPYKRITGSLNYFLRSIHASIFSHLSRMISIFKISACLIREMHPDLLHYWLKEFLSSDETLAFPFSQMLQPHGIFLFPSAIFGGAREFSPFCPKAKQHTNEPTTIDAGKRLLAGGARSKRREVPDSEGEPTILFSFFSVVFSWTSNRRECNRGMWCHCLASRWGSNGPKMSRKWN